MFFLQVQRDIVENLREHFVSNGLVTKCLEFAFSQEHVMDFTRMRALESLFSMLHQGIRNVLLYNQQHPDFPMEVRNISSLLYRVFNRRYHATSCQSLSTWLHPSGYFNRLFERGNQSITINKTNMIKKGNVKSEEKIIHYFSRCQHLPRSTL